MDYEKSVIEVFPELDSIENEQLRESVIRIWVEALSKSKFDDPNELPFAPKYENEIGRIQMVSHIREVTNYALTLGAELNRYRDIDFDMDILIAGAILHDVSTLYESFAPNYSDFRELLPHPYYGIHLLASENLSIHLQHIIVSHSPFTAVNPKTLEAQIIQYADLISAHAIFMEQTGDLFEY